MTEKYRATASRLAENYGGRELLPMSDVEKIIGLDRRTIISHRILPVRKVGNKLMCSVADIAGFLTCDTAKSRYTR